MEKRQELDDREAGLLSEGEDGILVSVVAKFRGVGKALEEAYGKIACCL